MNSQFLETGNIHRKPTLTCHQLGQIEREAVRVIQVECRATRKLWQRNSQLFEHAREIAVDRECLNRLRINEWVAKVFVHGGVAGVARVEYEVRA